MNIDNIRRIYLIGICGTAMASLAGLLKEKGYDVCGSDHHVYPPMSTQLEKLGIRLYAGYDALNLRDAGPDLVIPGNAVPRGNPEVEEMLNRRMNYVSMTEAIKDFFLRDTTSIVIAGTHGKTSTSSLAAWLLQSAGWNPSFLIGGIPLNFGTSFQYRTTGSHFVIEGDEYDTGFMDKRPKFVQYLPQYVILNPVEFDHADLYADFEAVENAFWQLMKVVPSEGVVIVNRDSESAYAIAKRGYSKIISFGYHPESDYRIISDRWEEGEAHFQVQDQQYMISMFGKHNIRNAAAVAVLATQLGLKPLQIQTAFQTFQGVKRRMELRGTRRGIAVYDDFAHHPTAIHATLEGARLAFSGSRIWAIFEPRSWSSRRNIFQNDFARSFQNADIAIIAGVFEPEKLSPEVRLDPEKLVKEIGKNGTQSHYKPVTAELVDFVVRNAKPGDKIILMSNGSFDSIHDRILEGL